MTFLEELVQKNSQPTLNLTLILATVWIINHDFAKYTSSSVTIGNFAITEPSRRYQNDLVDQILKRVSNPQNGVAPIKFLVEGESYGKDNREANMTADEQLKSFYKYYENRIKSIWILDSFKSYEKFEKNLVDPLRHYHRNGYFILIYTGMEHDRIKTIRQIFHRLFDIYVTNINVLIFVGKLPYLYTYFPFSQNKCHSSVPELYLSFSGIVKNPDMNIGKGLFPSKVVNMFQCELIVATWTYKPYIVVDKNETTGELISLHGIEGSLITLLSESMNFKIRIEEGKKDRGVIYPNKTATGTAGQIMNQEVNLTIISYMQNKERSDAMQASVSYLTLPYVLAMPQGKEMSPFERLMKPFRYIIWSCFSSSFLFGIIVIYYLKFLRKFKLMNFIFGSDNRIPFTNLMGTLLGMSIYNRLPVRNFARYILVVWLLYTFVLRSAYSSALYILLQDGRPRNGFSSISEIIASNYTIYAFSAVEKVIKLSMPQATTGVVDGGKNSVANLLKRLTSPDKREHISLCLLDFSLAYYNQENPNRRVDILDEPLLTSPIVFYMPKHSYFKQHMDDLIADILASGLIKRYQSLYLYSTNRAEGPREPIKLSLNLLKGLFIVYVTLMIFCFILFLLEILSSKSMWARVFVDFLNF